MVPYCLETTIPIHPLVPTNQAKTIAATTHPSSNRSSLPFGATAAHDSTAKTITVAEDQPTDSRLLAQPPQAATTKNTLYATEGIQNSFQGKLTLATSPAKPAR